MRATRTETMLYRVMLATWDASAWFLTVMFIRMTWYNFKPTTAEHTLLLFIYAISAMVLQVLLGVLFKLYQGRHTVGSFNEALALGAITLAVGASVAVLHFVTDLPRAIIIMAPPVAFLLMAAGRFLLRAVSEGRLSRSDGGDAERVLVYGAGNAGQQLARLIWFDPDSPYKIVGFIDDDPDKRNLHLGSSKVLGGREDLIPAANRFGVSKIILALPTATTQMLNEVSDLVYDNGMELLVLPPVHEIVGGKVDLATLHKIDTADLLGRKPIHTNLSEIAGYLSGKRVLVTGAGGSIGSEISKQVNGFGPAELIMLDHDESNLHTTQLLVYGQGLMDSPNVVLCDIRDEASLDAVFADHKPDVVFHAAALKHLPMLERYPEEGWKTNVRGTLNVLRCAQKYGVERFVNVSTDKAADPTSVLGKTKRIAEELTSWFGQHHDGTWLSVRFGNVLGSRGSMLHGFASQIEQGGPVTVTHPDVVRYFMTIPEACELTIQAGAIGHDGEVLVLDMGTPVNILSVAKGLIKRSGQNVDIVFTGLRDGEKLEEVLFSTEEAPLPTTHDRISRVNAPALDPRFVDGRKQRAITPLGRAELGTSSAGPQAQEEGAGPGHQDGEEGGGADGDDNQVEHG